MGRRKGVLDKTPRAGTNREKAWRVIRNFGQRRESFGVIDLELRTRDIGEQRIDRANLQRYLRVLSHVGVLQPLNQVKGRNFTYRLLRDVGPKPPFIRRSGEVFDPNNNEVLPDLREAESVREAV